MSSASTGTGTSQKRPASSSVDLSPSSVAASSSSSSAASPCTKRSRLEDLRTNCSPIITLPLVILALVSQMIGTTARAIAQWEVCSTGVRMIVRALYCRHCGRILKQPQCGVGQMDGGHKSGDPACSYPDELDPFAPVYEVLGGMQGFHCCAGGWPAFLHFQEHRFSVRPWLVGGAARVRDLDIWVDEMYGVCAVETRMRQEKHWKVVRDGDIRTGYCQRLTVYPSVPVTRTVQTVTHVDDTRCVTQHLTETVTLLSPGLKLDVISTHAPPDALAILSTFDFPWCRVGFQVSASGAKQWILHPTHSRFRDLHPYEWALPSNRYFDVTGWVTRSEAKLWPSEVRNKLQALDERRSVRWTKYNQRGYPQHAQCACPPPQPSSSIPAAPPSPATSPLPSTPFVGPTRA